MSIFVDESGHFGMKTKHSPYYIVSFVFHDQSNDITQSVAFFEEYLSNTGFPNHCVHTEPIIHGESVYEQMSLEERKKYSTVYVVLLKKSVSAPCCWKWIEKKGIDW